MKSKSSVRYISVNSLVTQGDSFMEWTVLDSGSVFLSSAGRTFPQKYK